MLEKKHFLISIITLVVAGFGLAFSLGAFMNSQPEVQVVEKPQYSPVIDEAIVEVEEEATPEAKPAKEVKKAPVEVKPALPVVEQEVKE